MKKHILRIYDFIRSWIYYPKMTKFLNGIGIKEPDSRFEYALWHCKTGKLSDMGYENINTTFKDVSDGWKCVYRNVPITKKTED